MRLLDEFKAAVSGHGHGCTCDRCAESYLDHDRHGVDTVLILRLLIACVLFVAALAAAKTLPALTAVLSILSILSAGYEIFIRAAVKCVRERVFDETLLMCVVVIAAVIIGEGREGAAVMILLRAGQIVQGYLVGKVRGAVDDLMTDRSDEVRSILSDIRSAGGNKSAAEDFISHFALVYTPVVLGIALVIAVVSPLFLHTTVTQGVHRALVLLVIACPCAIVISVPLSYYAGIGGAARQGVLFHDSATVDAIAHVGAVVLDQKSALEGEGLRVVSIKSDRMDADVFLRIAAHACAYSGGVYAESIKAAYPGTIYIELIQSFRESPGQGITVEVEGVSIVLGTEEFVREHGVEPGSDVLPEQCAYLAINGEYAGRILFGSVIRDDAAETVTALAWEKERPMAFVTEKSAAAAEKFAHSVGISQYYADCGPEEKAAAVREIKAQQMKKGKLLYIGSAEGDLGCFQEADIGAALGGASSDTAIRESDVAVLGDSPAGVITAMGAAKHIRSVMRQGILFALAFKQIGRAHV